MELSTTTTATTVATTTTNTAAADILSSSSSTSSKCFIRVCEDLPSIEVCTNFVNDPGCGAIATFIGTTRDNFQGKKVTKLSYEGYIPMAIKELYKLCEEATIKYKVHKIAAVHIVGDCPVGQPSVILACSSPHRREALHCVEYLIDTLKARVPIWKRECYEGDDAVWKENVEWKEGTQQRVMVKLQ
jgi:molybdopterin synthase catalytic subunit